MQPIVDGLENEYQETVEFVRINVSTNEGLDIFDSYLGYYWVCECLSIARYPTEIRTSSPQWWLWF